VDETTLEDAMANTGAMEYQGAALAAVELAVMGLPPNVAWDTAATFSFKKASCAEKPCPRSTFIGLAEAGVLAKIPSGKYLRSAKNKRYALDALALLRADESLADMPLELWRRVMKGEAKTYNQQMHVVCALWKARKFVGQ
jgi:hypothetical protein